MTAPTTHRPTADWVECVDCTRRGIGLHIDLITGQCRRCTPTQQGN